MSSVNTALNVLLLAGGGFLIYKLYNSEILNAVTNPGSTAIGWAKQLADPIVQWGNDFCSRNPNSFICSKPDPPKWDTPVGPCGAGSGAC